MDPIKNTANISAPSRTLKNQASMQVGDQSSYFPSTEPFLESNKKWLKDLLHSLVPNMQLDGGLKVKIEKIEKLLTSLDQDMSSIGSLNTNIQEAENLLSLLEGNKLSSDFEKKIAIFHFTVYVVKVCNQYRAIVQSKNASSFQRANFRRRINYLFRFEGFSTITKSSGVEPPKKFMELAVDEKIDLLNNLGYDGVMSYFPSMLLIVSLNTNIKAAESLLYLFEGNKLLSDSEIERATRSLTDYMVKVCNQYGEIYQSKNADSSSHQASYYNRINRLFRFEGFSTITKSSGVEPPKKFMELAVDEKIDLLNNLGYDGVMSYVMGYFSSFMLLTESLNTNIKEAENLLYLFEGDKSLSDSEIERATRSLTDYVVKVCNQYRETYQSKNADSSSQQANFRHRINRLVSFEGFSTITKSSGVEPRKKFMELAVDEKIDLLNNLGYDGVMSYFPSMLLIVSLNTNIKAAENLLYLLEGDKSLSDSEIESATHLLTDYVVKVCNQYRETYQYKNAASSSHQATFCYRINCLVSFDGFSTITKSSGVEPRKKFMELAVDEKIDLLNNLGYDGVMSYVMGYFPSMLLIGSLKTNIKEAENLLPLLEGDKFPSNSEKERAIRSFIDYVVKVCNQYGAIVQFKNASSSQQASCRRRINYLFSFKGFSTITKSSGVEPTKKFMELAVDEKIDLLNNLGYDGVMSYVMGYFSSFMLSINNIQEAERLLSSFDPDILKNDKEKVKEFVLKVWGICQEYNSDDTYKKRIHRLLVANASTVLLLDEELCKKFKITPRYADDATYDMQREYVKSVPLDLQFDIFWEYRYGAPRYFALPEICILNPLLKGQGELEERQSCLNVIEQLIDTYMEIYRLKGKVITRTILEEMAKKIGESSEKLISSLKILSLIYVEKPEINVTFKSLLSKFTKNEFYLSVLRQDQLEFLKSVEIIVEDKVMEKANNFSKLALIDKLEKLALREYEEQNSQEYGVDYTAQRREAFHIIKYILIRWIIFTNPKQENKALLQEPKFSFINGEELKSLLPDSERNNEIDKGFLSMLRTLAEKSKFFRVIVDKDTEPFLKKHDVVWDSKRWLDNASYLGRRGWVGYDYIDPDLRQLSIMEA